MLRKNRFNAGSWVGLTERATYDKVVGDMSATRASSNLETFLKLDQRKLANRYVVIVGAKLVATGTDVEGLLRRAKRRYPRQVPFVAKVPAPTTLIFFS